MIMIFKVRGQSMRPCLSSGDFVVATRFYRKLTIGDIVVFQHTLYGRLIKRIRDINASGMLLLSGDNKYSLSSEEIGWLKYSQVQAKVAYISHSR